MFTRVTEGNTKQIYFGYSAAFEGQLDIFDYTIDGESLTKQTQGRFQTVWFFIERYKLRWFRNMNVYNNKK